MTRQANKGSFKKGDPRINRKGRPKKGQSIADRFEDMLNEVLDPETGYTVLDSMMDAVKTKALKGDQAALEYVIARAFGKMVERVERTNTNTNLPTEHLTPEERKELWDAYRGKRTDPTDTP